MIELGMGTKCKYIRLVNFIKINELCVTSITMYGRCCRDELKRHYNLKQYWLEVDIEDVASYNESLAEKLTKLPTETLPLVREEALDFTSYKVKCLR